MSIPRTATAMAIKMAEESSNPLLKRIVRTDLNPDQIIKTLHQLMDTPAPNDPVYLSVTERHQRLHYIMSEFIELVEASGFRLHSLTPPGDPLNKVTLSIQHVEGSPQDIIEMVDGLADIAVVALGMTIEMGYKLMPIFREVVSASVTKLNPDTGKIDKNMCQNDECHRLRSEAELEGPCTNPNHLPIPDEPVGKWIKGRNYLPPQIKAIIQMPKEKDQ